MAMEVDLALNARRFQAGTKDAERALEDLQDVVERFTDEASDAGDEAADSFSVLSDEAGDARRDVERVTDAVDDAEREFRDAARAAEDFGRDAERAGDDARDGIERAGEGLDDFKSEAASSGREAAASFSGEFDDVSDLVQEIAANAFGGFGPAGAAAGLVAAAGIGVAAAAFEAHDEAMEESKRRAAEWAQAFIEAGSSRLTFAQLMSRTEAILTDSDRYQEAADNAEEWGVSLTTAVAAMAGDATALGEAQQGLMDRQQELTDFATNPDNLPYGQFSQQLNEMSVSVNNGEQAMSALQSEMQNGATAASVMNETLRNMALTTEGATETVNEFGDSVYTLPDGAQIIIDAETGQASTDIENVAFQTNQLDGSTAMVTAQATISQAESVFATLVRNRTATVVARVVSPNGVPIAV